MGVNLRRSTLCIATSGARPSKTDPSQPCPDPVPPHLPTPSHPTSLHCIPPHHHIPPHSFSYYLTSSRPTSVSHHPAPPHPTSFHLTPPLNLIPPHSISPQLTIASNLTPSDPNRAGIPSSRCRLHSRHSSRGRPWTRKGHGAAHTIPLISTPHHTKTNHTTPHHATPHHTTASHNTTP